MISFRSKSDIPASVAIILSLLVLLGLAVFSIAVPKPDGKAIGTIGLRTQTNAKKDIATLEATTKEHRAKVDAKVWTQSLQNIGPEALKIITGYSREEKLKLVAFRPQKVVDVNGLLQLPFLISVQGDYLGVLNFVRKLERPDSKLATNLVQFSSTDGSSDLVTATVGVMAFTMPPPPPTKSSNKTDKSKEKDNAAKAAEKKD